MPVQAVNSNILTNVSIEFWWLNHDQCAGSVESVSVPWIRICMKKWLDLESGPVSNDTDPDPSKTIENKNNFNFLP